jgi:putative aminopeptidase FrvX
LDYKNLMNWLTGLAAVSGHEETLALHISEEFKKYCDKVEIDRFYNVVGIKKGSDDKRKKVMVAAHMDEIGFMIKSIDEKGFIRVTNIGGIDSRVLPAQEVVIHGKRDVPGVFGAKPPHLMDSNEEKKALKLKDLSCIVHKHVVNLSCCKHIPARRVNPHCNITGASQQFIFEHLRCDLITPPRFFGYHSI